MFCEDRLHVTLRSAPRTGLSLHRPGTRNCRRAKYCALQSRTGTCRKRRVGSRSSATHGWMPLHSPMGSSVYPSNGLPVGPLVHGAWDEACDGMVTSTTTPLEGHLIYLAWDLEMLGGRRANGYRIVGVHNGYLACRQFTRWPERATRTCSLGHNGGHLAIWVNRRLAAAGGRTTGNLSNAWSG